MKKYIIWADVPDNLRTKTQLGKIGLKPAVDQSPAAIKVSGPKTYELYDIRSGCVARRKVTTAQLAALKKARQQAALNSRCAQCGMPFEYDERRRYEITDTGNGAYICFICHDRQGASQWAQQFLADPNALILDTETTGLEETAQIVEIAIINTSEEVLLNTLVKPTIEISGGARVVYGIVDRDLVEAPVWPEVDENVFDLCEKASQIAIYNAEFDQRLIYQTRVAHGMASPDCDYGCYWRDEETGATPELVDIDGKIRCAMKIYAQFFGEWSSYHRSYRWQKLEGGGHRALDDCLATLAYIKRMAADESR